MLMAEPAQPQINEARCIRCGDCVAACPYGAVSLSPAGQLILREDLCRYCGDCEEICPVGAIALPYDIIMADTQSEEDGTWSRGVL
jgi:ferredoxin